MKSLTRQSTYATLSCFMWPYQTSSSQGALIVVTHNAQYMSPIVNRLSNILPYHTFLTGVSFFLVYLYYRCRPALTKTSRVIFDPFFFACFSIVLPNVWIFYSVGITLSGEYIRRFKCHNLYTVFPLATLVTKFFQTPDTRSQLNAHLTGTTTTHSFKTPNSYSTCHT